MSIAENLQRVQERIARAAEASGRTASDIALVGVTKYVGPREAEQLVAAGCHDLGESRAQELWSKVAAIGERAPASEKIRWHMIGHLQRNKLRRTLPLVTLVHSVDSERLLAAINEELRLSANSDTSTGDASDTRTMPTELVSRAPLGVLLEVNTSGEAAKHGLAPEAVEPLLTAAADYAHVKIRGLMTMAAFEGGPEVAARNFAGLRELRNRLRPLAPDCVQLNELSMGMSGDFEVAIREGATIVRVGSALWEST